MTPMGAHMTEQECRSLFTLAGIEMLNLWPTIDGYGYPPSDPRYFETPPKQVWWLVRTPFGLVHLGWRHRVIHIDWSVSDVRGLVTQDDVTKDTYFVHAWSYGDALKYLCALKLLAAGQPDVKVPDIPLAKTRLC